MPPTASSRARTLVRRARHALGLSKPRRYLFILSHMRSYSSLLCHILNTNPDVAGYVELHHPYRTAHDLHVLEAKVAETIGGRLAGRYVLDKVLHNKAEIRARILRRDDVYAMFSIREPEQTIRSTIAMVRRRPDYATDWKSDPTKVANYYIRRLDRLVAMAGRKPTRSLFFDADRLIDDTKPVLESLTRFLELVEPLSERYETFELTGAPRFGDPGRFISSGEIVRERTDYAEIDIPADDLARAREAYERARDALARRCEIVIGPAEDSTKPTAQR
jgi:hypothetical protein